MNTLGDYRSLKDRCEAIMQNHIQNAMEDIGSVCGTTPTSVDVHIVSKRTIGEEYGRGVLAGVEVEFDD